jgi:hypothetical protein
MTRIRFALVASTLFAMAGCDDDPSIPIGALANKFASAECDVGVRCGSYPDKATCMASLVVDLGQLKADVDAGRVKYDGNAAATCMTAFESTAGPGGCSVTNSLSAAQPAACRTIFTGEVAIGGACFASYECQSGSCDTSGCSGSACCAGSCVASIDPLAAAIGMACSALISGSCVDGAFCQTTGTSGSTGTCVAKLGAGQPCTSTVGQCLPGLICLGGSAICGKLPAEGSPCADGLCDGENDYCDPTTGLCAPRVGPGGACPTGSECVAYAMCDPAADTCVALGAAGTPCSTTAPNPCLGSLTCAAATGVCSPPPPAAVCQ